MNPLNIFQMMKNGNPQQFLQQMMGNNQIMRNPLMKNTIEIWDRHGMRRWLAECGTYSFHDF